MHINDSYGAAGRVFVARLIDVASKDESGLRRRIRKLINKFLKVAGAGNKPGSARTINAFALIYAAGRLAREWGVLPKNGGPLLPLIMVVFRSGRVGRSRSVVALNQVGAYIEKHRKQIVRIEKVRRPYSRDEFKGVAGFVRRAHGRAEILIPSARFRREFPNYRALMKDLKKRGFAKTEGGQDPKLTIKAPKSICATGRVYCVRLEGAH